MIEVSICVGSSCHLKGAADVVNTFKKLHKKFELNDKVHLKASFCQEHCTNGVAVNIDGKIITGVNPANAADKFKEYLVEGDSNGSFN
ncbi:MAG: (2Fe-2S) ferredoxin domain-containing protein [Bacillota bacterium]